MAIKYIEDHQSVNLWAKSQQIPRDLSQLRGSIHFVSIVEILASLMMRGTNIQTTASVSDCCWCAETETIEQIQDQQTWPQFVMATLTCQTS